jgi:predicted nucleic acid-binding Zn ribbon protein
MSSYRRNRNQFVSIGSVIDKLMQHHRPVKDRELLRVWEVWDRAVGTAIAANARPAAFKGDTLLVHVSSSTWLHHLRFLEQDLIAKLNAELEQPYIRSVKIKVGNM